VKLFVLLTARNYFHLCFFKYSSTLKMLSVLLKYKDVVHDEPFL